MVDATDKDVVEDVKDVDDKAAAETKAAEEKVAADAKAKGDTDKDTDKDVDDKDAKKVDDKPDDKSSKVLLSGDEDDDGGTPDKYKFDIPDDLKDQIDPEKVDAALETFTETAKKVGLSQEQFQELIEFDFKRGLDNMKAGADAYTDRVRGWAEATKGDKEIGGDKLDASLKTAEIGLQKVGDTELRGLLKEASEKNPEGLGLGNHPAILRLFARVGRLYEDPTLITGDTADVGGEASLKRMYPTMFKDTG